MRIYIGHVFSGAWHRRYIRGRSFSAIVWHGLHVSSPALGTPGSRFLHLAPVACFPALDTMLSRAWQQLHIFPRFAPYSHVFSCLVRDASVCRAWHLVSVTFFVALGTGHRLYFYQFMIILYPEFVLGSLQGMTSSPPVGELTGCRRPGSRAVLNVYSGVRIGSICLFPFK